MTPLVYEISPYKIEEDVHVGMNKLTATLNTHYVGGGACTTCYK